MKRNRQYSASSDEMLNWFDDNYEKTTNNKDTFKLKLIYENFKSSDYFNNLNKLKKRQNNYKKFVEKLQSNIFLKKYVKENGHGTYIIIHYKIKKIDEEERQYYNNLGPIVEFEDRDEDT